MDNLPAGKLATKDLCINGETLEQRAQAAKDAGHTQLGENLRRAAELTRISNEQVLGIYNASRPGRATDARLVAIAGELAGAHAPRTAALVRQAAGG